MVENTNSEKSYDLNVQRKNSILRIYTNEEGNGMCTNFELISVSIFQIDQFYLGTN